MQNFDYHFPTAPQARPEAAVTRGSVRLSVLSSRLLRLEYSPNQQFEDRPSQTFWFRDQPVPPFTLDETDGVLTLETDHLRLCLTDTHVPFLSETLSIELKTSRALWHYGDRPTGNLHGTARTLDGIDGEVRLEPGLMSLDGWSLVDDSNSMLFDDTGWVQPRLNRGASLDLYFFGYGHDYAACLEDFARVTGPTPLLPRYALGNWWSRYWPYSQDELTALMQDFKDHHVPLSVCIVDMEWHIVHTGNASSGWTGYTWNRELFPDPTAFLSWLHAHGLRTALNLHPADGVYPHEEAYEAVARHMHIDPASRQPIPFDAADPVFMQAYFELLHRPLEEQGVDFWWIDWQQGVKSRLEGLDPLPWLNHLHFLDLARGARRPLIFSRWGGLGSHRTPVGFSGDTVVSWQSLAFQPYFTATAANVAYGWWSHDIGGHMGGIEDGELYARWVQFGVFSPMMRLHSTRSAYQERRPWGYGDEVFRICRQAMQLRHALIPYLYTMAHRNTEKHLPLVLPMYYEHPDAEEAYRCVDQYLFGSELLAAPFLTPADPDTRLSRGAVWLPEGGWFNFFTGEYSPGGGWQALFGSLEDLPVFARPGALVPLAPLVGWGGVENPAELTLVAFPGASRTFELYEDDGISAAVSGSARTCFQQEWHGSQATITIHPAEGDRSLILIPAERAYTLVYRGVAYPARVSAQVDGVPVDAAWTYEAALDTLTLGPFSLPAGRRLEISIAAKGPLLSGRSRTRENFLRLLRAFRCESDLKGELDEQLPALIAEPALLRRYARRLTESQFDALWQTITRK